MKLPDKATNDSFSLEQQLLECWNITNDIQMLYESVLEKESMSKDDIANVLLGLKVLYDLRFDQTFRTFENSHKNLCELLNESRSENIGPGSPMAIYHALLDRLEERFPSTDSEMLDSSKHPAARYIEKIDALLNSPRTRPVVRKVSPKKKK